jgi:orotidine-5'-phosphate decarboxylase
MMLAQKAAEAIAEAAAEAAEAAEALAAANMSSPAEVAEAEFLLFDGMGSQIDYAAEDAADAAWAAAALAAAMPSPAEVAEAVAEVVEELLHLVSWEENRQARWDARVALGPFCVPSPRPLGPYHL